MKVVLQLTDNDTLVISGNGVTTPDEVEVKVATVNDMDEVEEIKRRIASGDMTLDDIRSL